MKKLVQQINIIFQQKGLLQANNQILCAVSGGQDSILLFFFFLYLKKQWNLNLQIIYCQHFWQKKNFLSLWQIWKIAFLFDIPICFVLAETKLENENYARNWRIKSIERVSALQKSSQIALGHTASDKIETALWHLIRGSSPNGFNSLNDKTRLKDNFLPGLFSINIPKKRCIFIKESFFNNNKLLFIFFKAFQKPKHKACKGNSIRFKLHQTFPINNSELFWLNLVLIENQLPKETKSINKFFYLSLITKFNHKSLEKKSKLEPFFYLNNYLLKTKKSTISFWIKSFGTNKKIKKIRPLLILHREDILKVIEFYSLPVMPDTTNNLSKLVRSKIRNQIFPILRFSFHSNIDNLIFQFLEITDFEQKDFEIEIQKIIQNYLSFSSLKQGRLNFNKKLLKNRKQKTLKNSDLRKTLIRNSFQKLPFSIQCQILKKLFLQYNRTQLNYTQIETIRFLVSSKKV